jgi:D-alanine-D-alanine ligase
LEWSSVTLDCSVAVIAGGLSFEREVSLRSGQRVAEALRERGYLVGELDADQRLVETLAAGEFDVAFLALHGRFGEDGTVASILELLGIPYTGSSFDASRLAFDKLAAKSVLRRAGLSVPPAIPLTEGALRELGVASLLERAMEELGLPLVVKPNRGGSALGIRLVERPDQLPAALMAAFGYDDTVLLEQRVEGTELALSVVDGLPTLPPVEIHPKEGWYDFSARYTHGAAEFRVPANLDQATIARCLDAAQAAHFALGCRDISRVDAILDPAGTCQILEVNTGPGLTTTSLVPMAADAANLSFADLAAHLTDRATARRPR